MIRTYATRRFAAKAQDIAPVMQTALHARSSLGQTKTNMISVRARVPTIHFIWELSTLNSFQHVDTTPELIIFTTPFKQLFFHYSGYFT